MEENPYQSPQFNQPAGLPRRRIVSSVLLFIGIGYLCSVAVAAVVTGLYGYLFWGQPWLTPLLYLAIAMIWYGRRLRRQPPSKTESRTTGRIVD
jgi:membrane protein implicated in regulation of membrane protease activity